jgi:metal-responsive CopG/Arc/MetJ family transcriptional regulator
MQSLKGKRVSVVLDKETLELEEKYQKKKGARQRSDIMRSLYYEFLRKELKNGL